MAWCDVKKKFVNGEWPCEGIVLNVQKQNQTATSETRKEVLKSYTDMIIYALGSAAYNYCHLANTKQLLIPYSLLGG